MTSKDDFLNDNLFIYLNSDLKEKTNIINYTKSMIFYKGVLLGYTKSNIYDLYDKYDDLKKANQININLEINIIPEINSIYIK